MVVKKRTVPPVWISAGLPALVALVIIYGGKLSNIKEQDRVAYPLHAAAATVLQRVGAGSSTVAEQWLKAGYHARTDTETDRAVNGLILAVDGVSGSQLNPSLCAIFHEAPPAGWAGGVWPNALRDQYAILGSAGLSCLDATIWGQVPDDLPITYNSNPPMTGIFHETWYPNYGVAQEPVPSATWLHNLAHGAVVVLYHCPVGCSEILAEADELRAGLSLDLNRQVGGARLLVTASDDIDSPIEVLAWGQSLQLDRFDRDAIAAFFEANVDRGPECANLYCPD
jgi:hypothetical protein